MENQSFVLKWHYHSSTLAYNLPRFLDSDLLTDATLSAEGRDIKVHRLVLASCSSYFFQLFQNTTTNQQPIVVLHNIKYEDLKAIISYIYYGQCLVTGAQIPRLVSVAEFLKIQGLSDMKFPDQNFYFGDVATSETNNNVGKCSAVYGEGCGTPKCDISKVEAEWPEEEEAGYSDLTKAEFQKYRMPSSDDPLRNDEVPDEKRELEEESFRQETRVSSPRLWMKKTKDLVYRCEYCGKTLSNQYNLKVHVETHQEGYHACQSCSHVSRSRDALRKHVSYRHPHECTFKKRKKLEGS